MMINTSRTPVLRTDHNHILRPLDTVLVREILSERPRRAGRVALTGGAHNHICVKEGTRQSQSLPMVQEVSSLVSF